MLPGAAASKTVLVVDDSEVLLALVAESLRKLGGFTVITATDGDKGLERYFEVRPDCVVIDVKMPGLDGYQLIRALRGDPASRATPLVILSALVRDNERLAGLFSGADEYLVKPIKPLELVTVVRDVLGRDEAERRRRQQALIEDDASQGEE
jgi:DNA-binding response OmpR family regulator